MDARWQTLLAELRDAHATIPALAGFCPFPDPLTEQPIHAHHIPAADLMCNDADLHSDALPTLRDAFQAAGPLARWRETYKGEGEGQDFLDKIACYEVLGRDTPFGTDQMRSFVIYFPAGVHYPWHHHPAEELYVVVAGSGEFAVSGEGRKTLYAGDTIYHGSNIPHALTTHDQPIMAYVLWRGDLLTKPVLTPPKHLQPGDAA